VLVALAVVEQRAFAGRVENVLLAQLDLLRACRVGGELEDL